jgi:hypothetical protein
MVTNLIGSVPKYESQNSNSGFHHYSGLYKNGKPYCIGCNTLRNVYNNDCIFFSTHAEMCVIYKFLKSCKLQPFKDFVDLSHFVIVVLRYGRDGTLKNSRPCNHCLDIMQKYRIKKIIYSTDDNEFITEKPEEMKRLHISSGWGAYNNPDRLKGNLKKV